MHTRPSTSTCQKGLSGEGHVVSYCQPLCVVDLAGTEESFERIVARQDEAGEVDEEGTAEVEEDEEKVQTTETQDHVDLGNTGLLLEVVEDFIFGELETEQVSDEA